MRHNDKILKDIERNKQSSLPWLIGILTGIIVLYAVIFSGVISVFRHITHQVNNQPASNVSFP